MPHVQLLYACNWTTILGKEFQLSPHIIFSVLGLSFSTTNIFFTIMAFSGIAA